MNKYKIKVEGISCTNCAKTITNGLLKKFDSIEVKVNITNGEVIVLTEEEQYSIEQALQQLGYPPRKTTDDHRIKTDLILAVVLSLPLLIGMFNHLQFSSTFVPDFFSNAYLQLVLATPIQFYIGRRYYKGAFNGLKQKVLGMDFLVALSSTTAYLFSIYLIGRDGGMHELYFEVSALIITIVLIGKYIEDKIKVKTNKLLDNLAALTNDFVTLENGDKKDIDFLEINDCYVVLANEKISADGKIVVGSTTVDESSFTGESKLAKKEVGNEVIGGSLNVGNKIIVEVSKKIEDNYINQIIRSVEEASLETTKYQRIADRISGIFVPIVLLIAIITFIATFVISKEFLISFENAITVIVISCPCSLGLATPTSIMVGNSLSAKEGILYKGSNFFEIADKLDVLCFDKTGTLTTGKPQVDFYQVPPQYEQAVFDIQSHSVHPISKTLVKYLNLSVVFENIEVEQIDGIGLKATINGDNFIIGNKRIITNDEVSFKKVQQLESKGLGVNVVMVNDQVVGMYGVRDTLKPDSKKLINNLLSRGITPVLITGDNEQVANIIAQELGIEKVYASTMPVEKSAIVEQLQSEGKLVGFVGDGVNDSVALKRADVAISVKSGSDIAIEASDVTLLEEDLDLIIKGLDISRLTRRNIMFNFLWAFSYNIVAIPLAAFGYLNMVFAAIFMGFSSIVVVLNALHLNRSYALFKKKQNK